MRELGTFPGVESTMKTLITLVFALSLPLSMPLSAPAADQSPEDMVRQITTDVLDAIKQDEALQHGDKQKALALAEQKVLPHLDFVEMTRLAAGRTWNTATPEQRDRLVAAFRAMLVRTYANAIDVYRGQTMKALPLRSHPGATDVTVRNQFLRSGQPAVPVEYAMKKMPGGWMIYDITVDGVSLVLTYRSQFEEAARNAGVEGLISQLQSKTRVEPALRSSK